MFLFVPNEDLPIGSSNTNPLTLSTVWKTPNSGALIALYALTVAAFCAFALLIASTEFFKVTAWSPNNISFNAFVLTQSLKKICFKLWSALSIKFNISALSSKLTLTSKPFFILLLSSWVIFKVANSDLNSVNWFSNIRLRSDLKLSRVIPIWSRAWSKVTSPPLLAISSNCFLTWGVNNNSELCNLKALAGIGLPSLSIPSIL